MHPAGTEVKGALTRSTDERRVMNLINDFSTPPNYGKGVHQTGFHEQHVFAVATTLHRYLFSLPGYLIPKDIAERMLVPPSWTMKQSPSQFDTIMVATIFNAICTLPPSTYSLLTYLLELFAIFAAKARLNGATIDIIAERYYGIFFETSDEEDEEMWCIQKATVGFLIEYHEHFRGRV